MGSLVTINKRKAYTKTERLIAKLGYTMGYSGQTIKKCSKLIKADYKQLRIDLKQI